MHEITNELSDREREILRLVATGASNKEIARQLNISANTVKVHLRNIFNKIGAASRTEAAMFAVGAGYVPGASPTRDALLVEETMTSARPTPGRRMIGGIIGLVVILLLVATAVTTYLSRRASALTSAQFPVTTPPPRWKALTPLSIPRSGLAVAVHENQIYAIAGEDANGVTGVVERYDPQTNVWKSLADKPTPVSNVAAAVIGGEIFVPGGILDSGQATNVLEIYDPRSDSWSRGAPLPQPVGSYALAAFEGKLYLFGGFDGRNFLGTVYEYDPGQDAWRSKAPLTSPRALAGAAVSGGKVHLLGGYDGKRALDLNQIYQPDQDDGRVNPWSEGVRLPQGRYAMGVTSISEILYLVGGTGDQAQAGTPLVFITDLDSWQPVELPFEESWSYLGLAPLGTQIYALGGEIDQAPSGQNWAYQAIYLTVLPYIR